MSAKKILSLLLSLTLLPGAVCTSLSASAAGDAVTIEAPEEIIETAEVNPMTWKPMDKGYITLCFDDNNSSLPKFYRIITGEYDFPICAAAIPAYLNASTIALLHNIENHGGEVLSHNYSHLTLNFDRTVSEIDYQLGECKKFFENEGFNINGVITAGGTGENKTKEFRTFIEPYVAKYYQYTDWYGVSTQYYKPRNYFSGRTVKEVIGIIDKNIKNKTWEVIYAHNFNECSEEMLYEVLDYLAEKKAEGLVDVVTYRYMHENFGDFRDPVDFGDTKYYVEYYATDGETVLGREVVYKGGKATPPTEFTVLDGYTFEGWSDSLENITGNLKVRALCRNSATGELVSENDPSVMTRTVSRVTVKEHTRIRLTIGKAELKKDNKSTALDVPAQIIDSRTMVPLRAIFEALGASVEWDDATKTVTSEKDGTTVSLTVGKSAITVNGVEKALDVPAQIVDSRTLVPVRAIAEAYGCDVGWIDNVKVVTITL